MHFFLDRHFDTCKTVSFSCCFSLRASSLGVFGGWGGGRRESERELATMSQGFEYLRSIPRSFSFPQKNAQRACSQAIAVSLTFLLKFYHWLMKMYSTLP